MEASMKDGMKLETGSLTILLPISQDPGYIIYEDELKVTRQYVEYPLDRINNRKF